MEVMIEQWLSNPYVSMIAYFSVAVLALVLLLSIFELVTRYKCWDEIRKGNLSVAMATSGKIFGICNIFRFGIVARDSLYTSLLWAALGYVLLLAAYFLFGFLMPYFRLDEEIEKDNRAVGLLAMIISISLSYIIGASIK
ncbi:DUF350 domain-containing protein [Paenibacillus melissococcoides]|uniref:DUF350 domain-containing protein n=1 Tax=Paenibacillus melissococcoides TaxID=2912268 RepID=A0ABM9G3F1_9BACL|nr:MULTISPECIES: DUF350 domain-containing protein [Paenibacillus]MEB9895060.1 DUF350 domain-containing protein [Bacillus cereus]MBG9791798.1 membrane protein [Paenibacillus dendritiformis]CAH8246149.1 DUF350 domain-containing protein [Paenibacillus melissococcoides]CAH8713111.1 DUF350 domain-containing protein [Paenibacillus melissococcoides]CAH8713846.1 DUF350 domain-containing protein [Paenibacillus melissococcoides]